jgi:heptosyltransferase-2
MSERRQSVFSMQPQPQRILVIRLSSIGDVILMTPLLRALRRRIPAAQIDVVIKVAHADLLRLHPSINHLFELKPELGSAGLRELGKRLRERHYDVVLDVHKNFRSLFLTRAAQAPLVLRHKKFLFRRWLLVNTKLNLMRNLPPIRQRYIDAAAELGVVDDGAPAEIYWSAAEEKAAEAELQSRGWNGKMPLVALAPGAGFYTKRWPVENFAEVANALSQRGFFVVILGGQQDQELAEEIQRGLRNKCASLAGQTSLLVTAAILKKCRGLIANDSGLMHMAEAVGIPLIAIFGSTTRELGFFPQLKSSRVLENKNLRCRPCSHLGKAKCPKGHFLCMRAIMPEQVIDALNDLLKV